MCVAQVERLGGVMATMITVPAVFSVWATFHALPRPSTTFHALPQVPAVFCVWAIELGLELIHVRRNSTR